MSVSECLEHGADKAKTAKQLCILLHVTERQLRRMIRAERLEGAAIIANTGEDCKHGYYLAACKEDYIRQVKRLRKQERSLCKARRAMVKALRNDFGGNDSETER